jgi:hypothetical protein
VSISTKALAGRSFPTALRKAKGTQLTRGQGLLYQLHMQAAAERTSSLPSPSYSRYQQQQQFDFQVTGSDAAEGASADGHASSLHCPSYGRQQQLQCTCQPAWAGGGGDAAAPGSLDGCECCMSAMQLNGADALARQAALAPGMRLQPPMAAEENTAAAAAAAAGSDGSLCGSPCTAEAGECSSRAGAQLQLSTAPSLTAPAAHMCEPQQP